MLAEIFLSIIVLPFLYNIQLNFDGFLNLETNIVNAQEKIEPQRVFTDYLDIKITALNAIAVDVQSGKILYKKNYDEVRPIASITKLMTALVFLDYNPGWQKEWFTIASDRRNGGIIYLNIGEVLTLENLFKTALIVSDNDSAIALSRATGFTDQGFIEQMNKKAAVYGLKNTQFVDPTGLNANNKSNVTDVAKLLNIALQNENIREATSTAYYEFEAQLNDNKRTVKLRNTDALLNSYLNILGGKTGSLELAGNCLAVKIKGDKGQEIIIVVLGSETNFNRFQDVKAISDWVSINYQWPIDNE